MALPGTLATMMLLEANEAGVINLRKSAGFFPTCIVTQSPCEEHLWGHMNWGEPLCPIIHGHHQLIEAFGS